MDSSTVGIAAVAAVSSAHVAIADLEVYERAVTSWGGRGQVCPQTSVTGIAVISQRETDMSAFGSHNGTDLAVSGTYAVPNSKTRTGYPVTSGTG